MALIALAVALRPRFGRLDRNLDVLTERDAPELHALVREVATAVRNAVRGGHGPGTWRVETGRALDAAAERLSLERQLTVREDTSLFATHPPTGLRHRMLGARPWQDPPVTLTEARAARIDAELAGHYERAGRALSWNA